MSSISTFFCGVLIAFISSWEVSLLSLLVVPLILLIGASYTKEMSAISAMKMSYTTERLFILHLCCSMTDNLSNQNRFCFCWRDFINQVVLRLHWKTDESKQERSIYKGCWNGHIPDCNFQFMGSYCVDGSCCCISSKIKWRRCHSCSYEHSVWCNVRAKTSYFTIESVML